MKSESSSSIVSRALDSKFEQSSHSREEVVVSSETSHATHATTVPKSSIASVVEVPRSEARSPLPQVQPPASSESNRKIRIKSSVAPAVVNITQIPPPTSINLVAERTLQRQNDRSRSRSPVVPLTRRSRSKSPPPATNTCSSSGSGIRSRLGAIPTPIPTVVSKPIQSTRPEGRFDQKRLTRRHSHSRSRSTSPKRRDAGPATKLVRSGPTSAYSTTSSSSPILTASSTTHTSAQSGTTSTTPTIPPSSSKSSEGTPLIDTPSAHSAPPRRQRCRDYDERGFCLAGEFCPYDHGNDGTFQSISVESS